MRLSASEAAFRQSSEHILENLMKPRHPFTLRIFRVASDKWAGILIAADGKELGRVTGCPCPEDVERAVMVEGFYPDHIELEAP